MSTHRAPRQRHASSVRVFRPPHPDPIELPYTGGPYVDLTGVQAGDYIVTGGYKGRAGSIAPEVLCVVPGDASAGVRLAAVKVEKVGDAPELETHKLGPSGIPEVDEKGQPVKQRAAGICPFHHAAKAKKAEAKK